jgi:hypothetical protein
MKLIVMKSSSAQTKKEYLIKAANEFDMSAVTNQYSTEKNLSKKTAAKYERELKRFLALIALNPDVCFGMGSKEVDELWHYLIIDTKLYQSFCLKVGGEFIHHIPLRPGEKSDSLNIHTYYKQTFEEDAPESIWGKDVGNIQAIKPCTAGSIHCKNKYD